MVEERPAEWIYGDAGWPPGDERAGVIGWASGAAGPPPGPACSGCGEPVPWRELRWDRVPGYGTGVVVPVRPAWHGPCERRARWAALAAAGRDLVEASGLVLVACGRLVPTVLDGYRRVLDAGLPPVVEQGRAAVAAAGPLVEVVGRDVRRRVRGGPRVERWIEPAARAGGTALAVVLDRALRGIWWVERVGLRVREARAEWVRGVGYTRAWREALHGDYDMAPEVVALRQDERDRRAGWDILPGGERFRPIGISWDLDGVDPSAGEAPADGGGMGSWVDPSAVRRAFEDDAGPRFRRAYLNGWVRGTGPARDGQGGVDTPERDRDRRPRDNGR